MLLVGLADAPIDHASAKLADFGEAKFLSKTSTMSQAGTPLYMAPEIIRGESFDESVDIYALGVVANEVGSRRRD